VITSFLKKLRQKNIQLMLDGQNNLRVIADKGALDDAIKAKLNSNKAYLVDWLKSLPELSKSAPSLPLLSEIKDGKGQDDTYPLSNAQQRLWFVDQLEKGSTAYIIAAASKIFGDVDGDILSSALQKVALRHDSLRTKFVQENGKGFQKIVKNVALDIQIVDLSDSSANAMQVQDERLQSLLSEEVGEKFNLEAGPLFRTRLYKLAEKEYVLFMAFHHIISDGWSNHIFLAELAFYYDRLSRGDGSSELPSLSVQYKDFSVWQRRCLEGGYKEHLLDYWRKQLEGWQVLNLVPDNHRSANLARKSGRHVTWLTQKQASALKSVSQQHSVTLFTQLLSVFYVLMYKLSGQTNITVGTDVANRSREEVEGLIGFFVNQLVLRADLAPSESYRSFVEHVREMTLGAYQHQDLPFDILVEEILGHYDLAHTPFFPVKFIMQSTPDRLDSDDSWKIEEIELPQSLAKFDMIWSLTDFDERGIEIVIEYDSELFRADTIAAYSRFFCAVSEQIVENPSMSVSDISLTEQRDLQFYNGFNRFDEHLSSGPETLSQHVEVYAESLGQSEAVRDGVSELSYVELNRQANKLANVLREHYGAETGSNVGVCLPSGLNYVIAMVALSKLGATLVSIDVDLPAERAAEVVVDAELAIIVSESKWLDVLPAYELNFIALCCLDELSEEMDHAPDGNLNIEVSNDQLAYMIFTSGTTGKPKGVMVSHKGISTLAAEQKKRFSIEEQDRVLQFASIGFDASIWETVMALFHGASLHCRSEGRWLPGPELIDYMQESEITHVTLPPSALSVLPVQNLPSLKALVLASEACNDELLAPWLDKVTLYNAYGPSETTVCATIADLDIRIGGFNQSIGTPIMGTDVFVIDRDGQLAPPGVPGELCIGGVSLSHGYWQDPKQTADKFIVDAFSGRPGARLYRSGDKVRYSLEGGIEFLGRIDQQIKLRGYRIELQEIQNRLLKINSINQAVVVKHETEDALYAFVITDEKSLDQAEIKNRLRTYLPEYMIPKLITKLATIPTNINGKLDIDSLPIESASQFAKNWQNQELNPRETQIHAIWLEVLDIEHVGKYETFFDVGGYSLLLIKVQELLLQRLTVNLDIADLFKYPTIAGLAEFIDQSDAPCQFAEVNERLSKRNKSNRQRALKKRNGASI